MKNCPAIRHLLAILLVLFCGFMHVSAQETRKSFPGDAALLSLVQQHIQTPVRRMVQPNGEVFLQRDFKALLHAMPKADLPPAQDAGHDHNMDMLEQFLNRPHPSVATLETYFSAAAAEFGVPALLLKHYAQLQSNWAQVSASAYGSWGIMGLVENNQVQQITKAAELLQADVRDIRETARTNIRAAAALLAHYQQSNGDAARAEDWFESTRQLTGYSDADMQTSFTRRVYQQMKEGSKSVTNWGEIIWLEPADNISVPSASRKVEKKGGEVVLGNGTPDYPNAIYNLTNCNFNARPQGAAINYYFVHYIATGTYEGTISWFKNCSSQVSAHYVVRNSDGQITQMVDEEDRAWSQGVTEYNDQGIGVEHEVLATNLAMWDNPVMLQAAGSLASNVCTRQAIPKQRRVNNGDKGIYGHSDVRATDCPNMTQQRWDNFMSHVLGSLPSVGTPTLYTVRATANSEAVTASWKANTEPALLGYRLYYATNDNMTAWELAADESSLLPATTSTTLQPAQFIKPPSGPVHHFRLTAVVANPGNPPVESSPSDAYSRWGTAGGPKVLIVDGFDRISGSYKSNVHPFAASYLKAIKERGLVEVSTVANEKVEDGTIALSDYAIVVWFVGDESSANVVFSASEKSKITAYLEGGGKMVISGSEIAYNIGRSGATAYDATFMSNYLKATYVGDGAINFTPATGINGSGFDGLNIPFGIVYPEDYPDDIAPAGGATAILDYAVANTKGGIAYTGNFGASLTPGALIYIAFPLETASDVSMSLFMNKALAYFGIPPVPAPPIANADITNAASGIFKYIPVLANDVGNGSTINPATVTITSAPAHGQATVLAEGAVMYKSNPGYEGADNFQYRVFSTTGQASNESSVTLTVTTLTDCPATPPETVDAHPVRDLRGAWISTVSNIDWPSSRTLTPEQAQAELIKILDTLRNTGINTVFLQVRPECDALYQSSIEPWSYWLTNQQGQQPVPLWDPLQFAISAAHARGMDLHAWLNPYRAKQSTPVLAPMHIAVQHPEWTFTSASLTMLNPGRPEVREHLVKVVGDIANRYDVDGIHFDDYFYPYAGMGTQDNDTYLNYNPTNIATIEDWRRNNINMLIGMVYDTLQVINATQNRNIVFGVSPFGIWKSGTPAGISGTSSYSQIYCDPIAWLQAGKVDYLAPQLYWKITGGQDYLKLSTWWNDQGKLYGRHIYPGQALYKMADANNWEPAEIINQIAINRDNNHLETLGQVMFSTKQIMQNVKGIKDALQQGSYRYKSFAPAFAWKDNVCPNGVNNIAVSGGKLSWTKSNPAADGDTSVKYVIYEFANMEDYEAHRYDGTRVIAITGATEIPLNTQDERLYAIGALDKNNNETIQLYYNVILPVTGIKLDALLDGKMGRLTWETTAEYNTLQCIVEKSYNGREYSAIGSVAAAGNSNTPRKYHFADSEVKPGSNFYRIRITDKDGNVELSNSRLLIYQPGREVVVSPNPFTQSIRLSNLQQASRAELLDATGRILLVQTLSGINNIQLHVGAQPAGMYLLRIVYNDGHTETTRLLKLEN